MDRPTQQRYVLVLFQDGAKGPPEHQHISHTLVAVLRRSIEDKIQASSEHVEIDVWLESPGGLADSAYKLAVLLRAYAGRVRVVVPDYAKSAATLLALAADELYMAPAAELGPLDAQVPNPDEGGLISRLSALDLARSLDDLSRMAMEGAFEGGSWVLQITGLSRADSLTAMLDFHAKFMAPIIDKFDPKMIHWANSLLAVAVDYGQRLLAMHEGSELHPDLMAIPAALTENYPIHSFVISRQEAAEGLHLPVKPLLDYDLAKEVTALHRKFEDGRTNVVRLMTLDEVAAALTEASGGTAERVHVEDTVDSAQTSDQSNDRGGHDDGKEDGEKEDRGEGDGGE